jgi:hypothetical protein
MWPNNEEKRQRQTYDQIMKKKTNMWPNNEEKRQRQTIFVLLSVIYTDIPPALQWYYMYIKLPTYKVEPRDLELKWNVSFFFDTSGWEYVFSSFEVMCNIGTTRLDFI